MCGQRIARRQREGLIDIEFARAMTFSSLSRTMLRQGRGPRLKVRNWRSLSGSWSKTVLLRAISNAITMMSDRTICAWSRR